jgi:ubiquinone/menaquinone biosynthesis C-methylase UbiE
MTDAHAGLRELMKWMWSAGDYPALAARLQPYADALAAAAGLGPGMEVLDVAAGDGNLALAAARRGAAVTASDLTPRMVELGRARSEAAGLAIDWNEADVEELPFPADRFDAVVSAFGAIFAPRPERAAAELFRVVRPGGLVAMANYGSGGLFGSVESIMAAFGRPPAVPLPSPFEWGDPAAVRRRFAGLAASVEVTPCTGTFEFGSVEEGLGFWERANPTQSAMRSVLPELAYGEMRASLAALLAELNRAPDGRLVVGWDYVEVLARKPT